jgi:PPOX class probable F420-dependent enzyme
MNKIPDEFLDLVNCPRAAALTTLMPGGQPQTTVVWCDFDGTYVRVNTMRGFRKEKNMRADPKVMLLCFDPREPLRSLEVRGTVVEMTEAGAMEHLDGLSERYTIQAPSHILARACGAQRDGNPRIVQDPADPCLHTGRAEEGGVP